MNSAIGKINESLFLNLVSYVYSATILIIINIIFVQLYINHKTISILSSTFQKNILNSNISTLSFYIYSILLIFILIFIGETLRNIFNIIILILRLITTGPEKDSHLKKIINYIKIKNIVSLKFYVWLMAGDIETTNYQMIKASKNGMKLDKIDFEDTNARILSTGIIIDIVILLFLFHILASLSLIILLAIELCTIRIVSKTRKQMIEEYNKNY